LAWQGECVPRSEVTVSAREQERLALPAYELLD
jgi:hypothetical protein